MTMECMGHQYEPDRCLIKIDSRNVCRCLEHCYEITRRMRNMMPGQDRGEVIG